MAGPAEGPARLPRLHLTRRAEREAVPGQAQRHVGAWSRPVHHALRTVPFLRQRSTGSALRSRVHPFNFFTLIERTDMFFRVMYFFLLDLFESVGQKWEYAKHNS